MSVHELPFVEPCTVPITPVSQVPLSMLPRVKGVGSGPSLNVMSSSGTSLSLPTER